MAAPKGPIPINKNTLRLLKGLGEALGVTVKKGKASQSARKAAATRAANTARKKAIREKTTREFAENSRMLEDKYKRFYNKIDIEEARGTGKAGKQYVGKDRASEGRARAGAMKSQAGKSNASRRAEQDNLRAQANDRSLSAEKRVAARRKLRDHQKKYGNFGPNQGKR
jgi:hypothetical protein